MKCRLHRILMSCLLLSIGYMPMLSAQNMMLASGGPRFLYASSRTEKPIEIEVSRNTVLRQQVRLKLDHPTVGDILDALTEQTGFAFVYSRELIPVDRPVRLQAESISLAAALTEILVDTGADVLLSPGYQIALVRRPPPPADTTGTVVGTVMDSTGRALEGAVVSVEGVRLQSVTSSEGAFTIANVPAGDRVLAVRLIGYQRTTKNFHISAGEFVTLSVVLRSTPTVLQEIVTTGSLIPTEIKALPSPITVISSQEIERLHARRVDDLIRLAVPGAVAWEQSGDGSNPGSMGLAFRGASSLFLSVDQGSSNPKIFVDGIQITGGAYGYYPSIDPNSIDRMEILRGPQASAIYGSDAMGGVIQIFTKKAGDGQPIRLDAQAAMGRIQSKFAESGALRQDYSAGITGSSGDASFRVGGGYRQTGDWMPSYSEKAPHIDGALRYQKGPITVAFNARYETNNFVTGVNTQTNPLVGTPYCGGGCSYSSGYKTVNKSETYGLLLGARATNWWSHEVQIGIDRTNLVSVKGERIPQDTFLSYQENMDARKSFAYRNTLNGQLAHGLVGTLTSGIDHWSSTGTLFGAYSLLSIRPFVQSANSFTSTFYGRSTNTGIFTQGQLALNDAWFAVASIRAEDNSEFGENVNWPKSTRLGLTHVRDVSRGLTLKARASYGQAIRAPSRGARDSAQYGPNSYQLPNRDLREQRQFGPDMGFDLVFGSHGSIGVTYYYQIAKDFQYFTANYDPTTGISTTRYVNLARVKNIGWEIEGAINTRYLSGRATLGITSSKATDLGGVTPQYNLKQGEQLAGIPKHTATAALSFLPFTTTTITGSVAYRDGTEATDIPAAYACQFSGIDCRGEPGAPFSYADYLYDLDGSTKFGLSVDQQIHSNLSAFLTIEDLTNTGSKRAINNYSQLMGRITTLGVRMRY